jgi:hypothetical protein
MFIAIFGKISIDQLRQFGAKFLSLSRMSGMKRCCDNAGGESLLNIAGFSKFLWLMACFSCREASGLGMLTAMSRGLNK